MLSFLFKFVKFTVTSSFHFSSRPSEVFFLFCSWYDKYFKWDIIAFNAHKIPLFSTTNELTEMEFLELSLLRSPLLRWSGFWSYFGIITCSCWLLRRNAKKCGTFPYDRYCDVSVWCFFLWSDLEHRFSHAWNVKCTMPCASLPWLLVPTLLQWFLKPQIVENTLARCFKSFTHEQCANNQHPCKNKEALKTHGFSQREWIAQNIPLALNIPDIQQIRAINITKNAYVHGAFDWRSETCYDHFCFCFTASSIYLHIRHSRI